MLRRMSGPATPLRGDRTRVIIAFLVALTGAVWLAQGLGAPIGRSFMIGDPTWALAGMALIAVAAGLIAWPRLRRH
jgi:lipopolysaccharide export LptBFGC system permease protein LptF